MRFGSAQIQLIFPVHTVIFNLLSVSRFSINLLPQLSAVWAGHRRRIPLTHERTAWHWESAAAPIVSPSACTLRQLGWPLLLSSLASRLSLSPLLTNADDEHLWWPTALIHLICRKPEWLQVKKSTSVCLTGCRVSLLPFLAKCVFLTLY